MHSGGHVAISTHNSFGFDNKPSSTKQPMVAYMATRPCLISVSRRRLKVSMSPESLTKRSAMDLVIHGNSM